MNRRDFLTKTIASSTLVGLGRLSLSSFYPNEVIKITLLHTNDVHSHIDPFPIEHAKYSNMGGVTRRAAIVEKIRSEEKNVLLLDAGDIFQGTPYFNYYGGELEFKLMSMLGYDVATMGNHDFDNGLDGFYAQLPHATFDFVSANYNFKNTLLDGHIKPYTILHKNGIKIGIFGLGIALEGLVTKTLYKETEYLDPIEITQDVTRILKKEHNCDMIICLSHLGYSYGEKSDKISDVILATQTRNIDLIIGGHTHTFLEQPTIVKNKDNKDVLINQVGCYGIHLGRIDFYFDTTKKVISNKSKQLII